MSEEKAEKAPSEAPAPAPKRRGRPPKSTAMPEVKAEKAPSEAPALPETPAAPSDEKND